VRYLLVRASHHGERYAASVGEVTERVEGLLRGAIERGEYKAGDKLPSERVLAAEQQAGRTTVRLVLARLAAQGLIEAQHGRGYFVKPGAKRRSAR
jgi:GntR family transcriptional regulator